MSLLFEALTMGNTSSTDSSRSNSVITVFMSTPLPSQITASSCVPRMSQYSKWLWRRQPRRCLIHSKFTMWKPCTGPLANTSTRSTKVWRLMTSYKACSFILHFQFIPVNCCSHPRRLARALQCHPHSTYSVIPILPTLSPIHGTYRHLPNVRERYRKLS